MNGPNAYYRVSAFLYGGLPLIPLSILALLLYVARHS